MQTLYSAYRLVSVGVHGIWLLTASFPSFLALPLSIGNDKRPSLNPTSARLDLYSRDIIPSISSAESKEGGSGYPDTRLITDNAINPALSQGNSGKNGGRKKVAEVREKAVNRMSTTSRKE